MKEIIASLCVAAVFFFSACKKTENTPEQQGISVPTVNVAMVAYATGSACPPCGSWGWDALGRIMDKNKTKSFYLATYSANPFNNLFRTQEALVMERAWGAQGYPVFMVNGVAQLDRQGTNVNTKEEERLVNDAINIYSTKEVQANTGFLAAIDSSDFLNPAMIITTKTKFFKELNGQVYLAVYLMENNVKGFQAGHPDLANTLHRYVLRGAATIDGATTQAGVFGYPIFSLGDTTFAAGTEKENKFNISIKGYAKENLTVAAVLWKKEGDKFLYINGYSNQK